MSDLVAFLRARLDEDQDLLSCGSVVTDDEVTAHRRAEREVQAKRTLLRWFTDPASGEPVTLGIARSARDLGLGHATALRGSWVLREIAAVYSDHLDYDPEWAP